LFTFYNRFEHFRRFAMPESRVPMSARVVVRMPPALRSELVELAKSMHATPTQLARLLLSEGARRVRRELSSGGGKR
jgi:hypothetical protein